MLSLVFNHSRSNYHCFVFLLKYSYFVFFITFHFLRHNVSSDAFTRSLADPLPINDDYTIKPNSASFQLYGSVYDTAYWFVDVYLGYPKGQRQSLILDTGSGVTAAPCSNCASNCGRHIDPPLNLLISQSWKSIKCLDSCLFCSKRNYSPNGKPTYFELSTNLNEPFKSKDSLTCSYHVEYVEGSTLTGEFILEKILLQNRGESYRALVPGTIEVKKESAFAPFFFGCNFQETLLFYKQEASGIMGMEVFSDYGTESFVMSILKFLEKNSTKIPSNNSPTDTTSSPMLNTPEGNRKLSDETVNSNKDKKIFSVCISKSGGLLTFGDYHHEFHAKQSWAPAYAGRSLSSVSFEEEKKEVEKKSSTRIVFSVGEIPENVTPLFTDTSSSFHLKVESDELKLSNTMKRNMLSTASTNTPSYRMLMRLKPLQSAPLNTSEEIINLGYLQQDKDALDFVHCFTNTKPLNVYQSSTKNKSQVQPNALYLHFPSAVEKGIMRCLERKKHVSLKNAKYQRENESPPYFMEYTTRWNKKYKKRFPKNNGYVKSKWASSTQSNDDNMSINSLPSLFPTTLVTKQTNAWQMGEISFMGNSTGDIFFKLPTTQAVMNKTNTFPTYTLSSSDSSQGVSDTVTTFPTYTLYNSQAEVVSNNQTKNNLVSTMSTVALRSPTQMITNKTLSEQTSGFIQEKQEENVNDSKFNRFVEMNEFKPNELDSDMKKMTEMVTSCSETSKGRLEGNCKELAEKPMPWSTWNVPSEDVVTLAELSKLSQRVSTESPKTSASLRDKEKTVRATSLTQPIEWTPFVSVMSKDESLKPPVTQSYFIFITKVDVKGLSSIPAFKTKLPYRQYPREMKDYQATKNSRRPGVLTMVDSGTTLTTLPLLLYTSLWIGMLNHIVQAKKIFNSLNTIRRYGINRNLSKGVKMAAPLRIKGIELTTVRNALTAYVVKLKRYQKELEIKRNTPFSEDQNKNSSKKFLEEEWTRTSMNIEIGENLLEKIDTLRENIETQLLNNGGYEFDLENVTQFNSKGTGAPPRKLEVQQSKKDKILLNTPLNETENSTNKNESHRLKLLIKTTDLGSFLKPYNKPNLVQNTSSFVHKKRFLFPKAINMEEQDCWYFTNGEGDFKYFPNIEITFLEGGRYVWKPEAFLYETEQRNVYCSTIVLRTQEAEERNLRAEREPRSARREASENENPSNTIMPRYFIEDNHENDLSVLGVTFFIDHDLIFDISGWRLGMVQADCPQTNLSKRLHDA